MEAVEVFVAPQEDRYNDTAAALGCIARCKCCGVTFFWSPDAAMCCLPTFTTLAIVFGVVFTLWNDLGAFELCILVAFLSTAFISAFLVTCTDPGVYPRLRRGEPDPLHDAQDLVLCRVCGVRRPPRTSHCYQCNVCVEEHDHHCVVIGGCVGRRSLRWFVLYLVTVSSATAMGIFWVCRSLFIGSFAAAQQRREAINNTSNRAGHYSLVHDAGDENPLVVAVLVLLFVTLLLVLLLVGGLAIFHVFMLLTSTTRRESQRMQFNMAALLRPKLMWENLMHVACPPPSKLLVPTHRNDFIT
ncbi:hypothetical protein TraAM80_07660 [Trypanosoma rangeli]|uniref:Palmitoyltransferase n=1 Tax=Trypanosoma rangeli TaxID=5698 RepID=A0A3R7N519_TRYRA|nr:uncharacterized protein TraAM80_07660 [Trypanosoma rangeli]RNF00335.1 hypothetical protein TraAM80_07660 [Trypanosoma rangeli]|eukprot:RNF00335.1 hypothetical protein TraAM80_07660 [Trypanosoma rangeli]